MKRLFAAAAIAALLTGCGGGTGDAGGVVENGGASLQIAAKAATAETVIYAVELTLRLPSGVTVDADPVTGSLAAGVLQSRVSGALAAGRLFPATATVPASLQIDLAYPSGFVTGPIAAVSCRVAPGAAANASAFVPLSFSARDANGVQMSGITAELSLRKTD